MAETDLRDAGAPAPEPVRHLTPATSGAAAGLSRRRWLTLLVLSVLLCLSCLASLFLGSRSLGFEDVLKALGGDTSSPAYLIIWEQRVPRTILGVLCGAALAAAGSLMQTLTRNPLAEPGLLGVNAGAAVMVVLAVILFGPLPILPLALAAFIGAVVAVVAVFTLGGLTGQSMARFVLAGVALAAALSALNQALLLANQTAYNEFRFWAAGSLEGRGTDILLPIALLVIPALLLGFALVPSLKALSVGAETATSLGVSLVQIHLLTLTAVCLLAAAATAAIGPITFVGLAVPFVVRALVGNHVGWVTLASVLAGPTWLLASDIFARTFTAPTEIQVGIVTTLLGGPLFIALMVRRKVEQL